MIVPIMTIFVKDLKILLGVEPSKSKNSPQLSFLWFFLKNDNLNCPRTENENIEISRNSA